MTAPQRAGTVSDPAGPRAGRLEQQQVRAMFDRIAGVYDVMNSAMTAGLHHRWRARAADLARVGPGDRVLDVATGTGDLAIELARRVGQAGSVVGGDFSEAMLERARAKTQALGAARPRFEWLDAMTLPYDDDSFDAATVGFGARNFDDLARGLREMARVVRPGGRVVVLEITTPTRPPLAQFYALWFDRFVPALGAAAARLAALRGGADGGGSTAGGGGTGGGAGGGGGHAGGVGIADAYAYLPSSVKRFPAPRELAAELERAGLVEISYLLTAGGIVAVHAGTVAERRR